MAATITRHTRGREGARAYPLPLSFFPSHPTPDNCKTANLQRNQTDTSRLRADFRKNVFALSCWHTSTMFFVTYSFTNSRRVKSRSNSDSKQKQKQLLTNHMQCVTFVTVTKCHNFELVTSVARSGFLCFVLAKQIWSHFRHKSQKWSQIRMWLVQTCFCFCFDRNGSV